MQAEFELLNAPGSWELWLEFWRFEDMNALWVLSGSILLGISASVIGAFAFLRRRSLIGDALAHAALPGVMSAFLLFQTRDPVVMFLGAVVSSFAGFFMIDWLPKHTKIKADAALAITLSFFFALGLMLLSYIQGLNVENKSGLDKILFGQAAAMSQQDITLLMYVTVFILLVVTLLFQKLRLIAFNLNYARTLGIPVRFYEFTLALLIVMSVVVGLQLVGVVLMAAVLLTPVAAARFWSNQLTTILVVAGGLGAFSAIISTQISYLAPAMPTGPWMVVSLALLFIISLLFAPQRGLVHRYLQQRALRFKVAQENILRTLYKLYERGDFQQRPFNIGDIQALRAMPTNALKKTLKRLCQQQLIEDSVNGFRLTEAGLQQAQQLTRRHRLWENYLNEQMDLPPDQVHTQAERIEHLLTEEQEQQLEMELANPHFDPHGRDIPQGDAERQPGVKAQGGKHDQ
ncbi:iron chelate uptake ABC transporter family permease subunit [Thiomicrorhabdus sp. zzn3]|uniref:metal ABC transporter permease n=1 Tax=Thiomicrorhabdus sp. zzn3 TaxID=3039775 RepID=UPI0024365942|nr:iron chelate uptake ABC transporter family permease subunit [Thiomicrorhabdus sp. zzn3]MDG6778360.1 iron chelate uptake ABC transporter family permease subunit [Thiomicrorhabdus sp. zzn3]